MGKKIKKTETSKLIFWLLFTMASVVIAGAFIIMWHTMDASPLQVLIPAVFAALTTATGFYFWKSRKENIIKLMKAEGLEISKEDITEKEGTQNGDFYPQDYQP